MLCLGSIVGFCDETGHHFPLAKGHCAVLPFDLLIHVLPEELLQGLGAIAAPEAGTAACRHTRHSENAPIVDTSLVAVGIRW